MAAILPRQRFWLSGSCGSAAALAEDAGVQVVSSIIGRAMPGDSFQQTRAWADEQIMLYVDYVGACERISKTPIPLAYTVSRLRWPILSLQQLTD